MSLSSLRHGKPQVIAHGHAFTEGPAWHHEGWLLYSDIPQREIYRLLRAADGTWIKSSFVQDTGTNGLTIDAGHRLWICGDFDRCLYTVNLTRDLPRRSKVLSTFEGKKFNSPNDIVFDATSGWVFFTDPKYGLRNQTAELEFQGVYAFHLERQNVLLLEKDLCTPNGLVLSHARDFLFVADSESDTIFRYPLTWEDETPHVHCRKKSVFAKVPIPDGLRLDGAGRLYAASHVPASGVHVFAPSGERIANIQIPEACSNCALQHPSFAAHGSIGQSVAATMLFVTAQDKVYAVTLA